MPEWANGETPGSGALHPQLNDVLIARLPAIAFPRGFGDFSKESSRPGANPERSRIVGVAGNTACLRLELPVTGGGPGIAVRRELVCLELASGRRVLQRSLPLPARDLVLYPETYPESVMGALTTSRGCAYNCGYCSAASTWTRKVRTHSVDTSVQEIRHIVEKYGSKTLSI